MGILKAIIKTVIEIPISATKDVLTMGGVCTDRESYLKEKYEEILDEIDD